MRLVTGYVILVTIAACPASANEAFITQLTGKAAPSDQSSANRFSSNAAKTMPSAAMLALPLQPKAVNLPVVATAAANTSSVMQVGSNNFAAVSQTGAGNASSVVQHGSGNQAVVTQRH